MNGARPPAKARPEEPCHALEPRGSAEALLFLYRTVLGREVGELEVLVRAKRRRKLPTVLKREEVRRILSHLTGLDRLFVTLLSSPRSSVVVFSPFSVAG